MKECLQKKEYNHNPRRGHGVQEYHEPWCQISAGVGNLMWLHVRMKGSNFQERIGTRSTDQSHQIELGNRHRRSTEWTWRHNSHEPKSSVQVPVNRLWMQCDPWTVSIWATTPMTRASSGSKLKNCLWKKSLVEAVRIPDWNRQSEARLITYSLLDNTYISVELRAWNNTESAQRQEQERQAQETPLQLPHLCVISQ